MAELDQADRDKLRKDQFAYVDKDGGEHLPIHDASHVRNAMARWNQTDFQSATAREEARRRIVAAAKRFDIESATTRTSPTRTGSGESNGIEAHAPPAAVSSGASGVSLPPSLMSASSFAISRAFVEP